MYESRETSGSAPLRKGEDESLKIPSPTNYPLGDDWDCPSMVEGMHTKQWHFFRDRWKLLVMQGVSERNDRRYKALCCLHIKRCSLKWFQRWACGTMICAYHSLLLSAYWLHLHHIFSRLVSELVVRSSNALSLILHHTCFWCRLHHL
jgi:hypothetical protein